MNKLEHISDTVRETYGSYLEGKSIQEIAKLRGLKETTIYSHFEILILNKLVELDDIINSVKKEKILSVLRGSDFTNLKEIKDQLDESIGYGEIRCVLAFVRPQNQLYRTKKATSEPIVLEPENKMVFEKLKEWRRSIAFRKNIPPYCIFHDSTLISIANKRPQNKEELKEIKGMSVKSIESYGEDILKIMNKYNRIDSSSSRGKREIETYNKGSYERVESLESSKAEIFTVGELTKYIKNILESDKKLTNLWVRGEISNLRQQASGHIYFSLKDKESQIKCVLFRRVGEHLNFNLEHGMKIIVRGDLEVYEPYGEYSIIIEEIQPDGLGALNLAFIQLKNKLEKEGLFSNKHKKPLPKFPEIIGIITSSTGAAIQDILNIIRRRYPLVRILIAPTTVQGKEAATSIVDSIKLMNELSCVDVIILGRGGGSLEDLWCFNEEIVARAIFKSKIPIISAVGHETDFTIADFVADYRAPTPSAAAEKVVPDAQELYEVIYNLHVRNIQAIRYVVELHKSNLKQILNRPIFKRPFDRIHSYYRELDHTFYKLQTITLKNTTSKRKELEIMESKIFALSPTSILKRGYSIIMKDNKIVKSFSDVKLQDNINVILHKGKLDAQVKKIRRD
ncbi:MAG: exodeoxyribonuclease VII large subunit [Candidatus Aenigmatarchaeota archaeon]